ncbi:glycosyltransferase [Bacillus sp. WLY-B-L8]|uniref:glycosyltransferase n=1 Tax=Bacillus multifaciens TaxID=3068506 RepID=UPI002741B60D|nr:glycosyltransferase [Bacillus sp. WLY-B-L8]MDP7978903.1 glycosyl transferase [Bacillus sp. WLY-B-L8]
MNSNDRKGNVPRPFIPSKEKINFQLSRKIPVKNRSTHSTVNKNIQLDSNKNVRHGNHLCVIVGTEYVLKVIALQQSLMENTKECTLWICCIDSVAYSTLKEMNLNQVMLIRVEEMEDNRLKSIKAEREVNEYCWTLKPVFIEYLLVNFELPSVLYCDGDLYFFSNPAVIFDEWGGNSVFLCPQRDRDWVEQAYGKYQAGLIGFKNDSHGLKSVRWWKEKCLDWCSSNPDNERFGDQKYLDNIPIYFPKVKVSRNLGVNAAPWNCIYNNNFSISKNLNKVYIETDQLVVYHFACITIFSEDEFDLWSLGKIEIPHNILDCIYTPYLSRIQSIISELKLKIGEEANKLLSSKHIKEATTPYKNSNLRRQMNQWDNFLNFSFIISQKYIIQGLTSYYSLAKQAENFNVWICCMDDFTYERLIKLQLKHAIIIHVKEVENQELLNVKNQRSLKEYCWTLKAPFCLHILKHYPEVDHIIYCDADMYFFSNPNIILSEWWKYSVFLCPQRGTTELESIHGMYQAGLIGFKNDKNGEEILEWWRDKCIEYCEDKYEMEFNRWGDQKYLNHIPDVFSNIKIMDQKGINAAPWNVILNNQDTIRVKNNKIFVTDDELIAFHFGSMQIFNMNEFDLWKHEYLKIDELILKEIYVPYIESIRNTCHILYSSLIEHLTPLYVEAANKFSVKNYIQYSTLSI